VPLRTLARFSEHAPFLPILGPPVSAISGERDERRFYFFFAAILSPGTGYPIE